MSSANPPSLQRNMYEVYYVPGMRIGFRFRPRLVLSASSDLDLRHSARVLALRTYNRGGVARLALESKSEVSMEGFPDPSHSPQRPVDFRPAIAHSPDTTAAEHLVGRLSRNRRIIQADTYF